MASRAAAVILCFSLSAAFPAAAQEKASGEQRESEPAGEREPRVEAEYVASSIFRSANLLVSGPRSLQFEGDYFGTPEFNVGVTGVSWKFQWKALTVAPGFGVVFGKNSRTAPVVSLRWKLETRHWFSQGYYGQPLGRYTLHEHGEEISTRSAILDNNHVSFRYSVLEVGPLWEHIEYREENEWKGGVRVAARLGRNFKLIFQGVGPGQEYRGGLAFER